MELDSMRDVNRELRNHRKVRKTPITCYSNCQVDRTIYNNSLIERINSIIPDQATKMLPNITGLAPSKEKRILSYLLDFNWEQLFRLCGYLANRYGGAYILLDVNDGRDIAREIDFSSKPSIIDYHILTQEHCHPQDRRNSWDYSPPKFYEIQMDGVLETVHHSRVLSFTGFELHGEALTASGGKHMPLWANCFPGLENYDISLQATVDMLRDASVFIYSYKGLHDLLAEAKRRDCGDEQVTKQIVQRISALVDGKSITDAMSIDMENESVEFVTRDYQNVDAMVKTLRLAFAEKTGLPVSVLFSSSESGLFSDSGASDRYALASSVNSYQRKQHTANLRKLIRIIEPKAKGYTISFPSTAELTQEEQADAFFTMTKALASMVVSGVLSQSQAARYFGERQLITHHQLTEEEINAADKNVPQGGAVNENVGGNTKSGVKKSN